MKRPPDRPPNGAARAWLCAFAALALAACGPGSNTGTTDGGDAALDGTSEGGSAVLCPTPTQTSCGGACVDVQSSAEHCGACGRACVAGSNATARCSSGVCRATCAPGFSDCDGDPSNGCEVELAASGGNCGACGAACPMATNASPACREGTCGLECGAGFSDCDGAYETGCESNTASDRENCGACGRACPWPPRSDFSCAASACAFACRAGYADCDRAMANGCEVSLLGARNCGACGTACSAPSPFCARTGGAIGCVAECPAGTMACDGSCVDPSSSLEHCGMCGNACRGGVNAQAACVDGRCGLECRPGYADCDGDPSNGCEVNLALNAMHCGACGRSCAGGPGGEGYCSAGECRVRCQPNALDCDGNPATGCEVNRNSDQRHCGACGRACMSPSNAAALCNVGVCEFACDEGYGNCDGDAANGCESVLRSNPLHCGACGRACPTGQSCVEGQCRDTGCMPGRGECDGNPATPCETDVFTSMEHCGACGSACMRANAIAACRAGGCQLEACFPNFGNCDGNRANGCETELDTIENCGGCGVRCSATNGTPVCNEGRCAVMRCADGFADCDNDARNGCETDTRSSALHCGRCGAACVAGQSCMAGDCRGVIVAPDAGSDGGAMPEAGPGPDVVPPSEGGVGPGMDAMATGDATAPMDAVAMGDGAPATDGPAPCPAGQMRCAMDGACVDLASDNGNCGMCGRACGAGQVCTMGTCGCPAGQALCGGRCVDTAVDGAHCGMCDRACATGQSCSMGACACPMGGMLCGGSCVNTQTDATNCGMCGRECGPRQTCAAGDCVCPTGETRCGSGAAAACVNTQSDNDHCGACGTACTGGQTCVMGACACPMGQTSCGAGAMAACTNTQTDTANCGMCGRACPAGQVCNGGMCTLTCTAPRVACGSGAMMSCADTQTDGSNCGSCGTRCDSVANTSASLCSGGRCLALCEAGFANCDGMYANGCEADLGGDMDNCGMCGSPCPTSVPNAASVTCAAGACRPVCAPDTATARTRDCNGTLLDGCETNVLTANAHCGTCGNACPATLPGAASVSCAMGSCTPACAMNRGNCDNNNGNGCETDLQTSTAHCGGCGMACPSTLPGASSVTCATGACAPVCATNRGNCDRMNANGCETDLQTSDMHCGACGNACMAGDRCDAGRCVPIALRSCREILGRMPGSASGEYDIDPDGAGGAAPFRVYCDMTTDGGGWTLLGTVHNGAQPAADVRRWNTLAVFTDTTTFGSIANRTTDDFKSPAWRTVSGADLMIQTDEYHFGFRGLLGDRSFGSFVEGNWPTSCSTRWTRSGADFASSNLTANQQRFFGFTLRGLDSNASCFPSGGNENVAISLNAVTCCWVNGLGNYTGGVWGNHDLSLPTLTNLRPVACTAGSWPCNANGLAQNASGQSYDRSTKVRYAMVWVR